MSKLLDRIRTLILKGEVRISDHGYDELQKDDLTAREIVEGVGGAVIVEEYPDYQKGACLLVLQEDRAG